MNTSVRCVACGWTACENVEYSSPATCECRHGSCEGCGYPFSSKEELDVLCCEVCDGKVNEIVKRAMNARTQELPVFDPKSYEDFVNEGLRRMGRAN